MQLLDFAKRILAGSHITIMDVGARNLTLELPELAPVIDAYGFEPNPEEFHKLQDGQTDTHRMLGISQPQYASCHYDPHAVHDRSGEAPLYITEGPGSCSLLEPNQEVIDRFASWVGHDKPFGPEFRVVGQTPVPLTTIPEAADRFGLGHIDYLKLDTQGNELHILEGCRELLAHGRIGVIKCEVEFQELYRGQPLFADVDALLRSHGYMLLDLRPTDGLVRVTPRSPVPPGDRGVMLFSNAYYCLAPAALAAAASRDPVRPAAHALVLIALGFKGLGLDILARHCDLDPTLLESLRAWLHNISAKKRLYAAARRILPSVVVDWLNKLV